ncbi:hypothetical protein [Streptomyces sp. SID1328]|uniref:hypothetical protein n=1 Tax=Streptomyces sp. SID1328 TaxID=2690250 RepID=UPI001F40AEC3|nr:hypothetical protein [Streptomyces sp. SID1328]
MGLATARRVRAEGGQVVLTGRDPERLQQAARELQPAGTAAFDATDTDRLELFFRELTGPVDHVTGHRGLARAGLARHDHGDRGPLRGTALEVVRHDLLAEDAAVLLQGQHPLGGRARAAPLASSRRMAAHRSRAPVSASVSSGRRSC